MHLWPDNSYGSHSHCLSLACWSSFGCSWCSCFPVETPSTCILGCPSSWDWSTQNNFQDHNNAYCCMLEDAWHTFRGGTCKMTSPVTIDHVVIKVSIHSLEAIMTKHPFLTIRTLISTDSTQFWWHCHKLQRVNLFWVIDDTQSLSSLPRSTTNWTFKHPVRPCSLTLLVTLL